MPASDPAFDAYLRASANDADAALTRIVEEAGPVIREVCGSTLGFGHSGTEDAAADALLRLIMRVRRLRDEGDGVIENLAAYAATTARRVCADYLRRAHPLRARLGSRVRYALSHDPALQQWRSPAAIICAGLAAWNDRTPLAASNEVWRIASELRAPVDGPRLLDAIRAVLERAGGWVEVGVLITALFDGASMKDPVFTPAEEVDLPASPAEDPPAVGESRRLLSDTWREIASLPARQRTALLLHLPDESGGSGLARLVLAGVATLAALAAALEITPAALAELWPSLPLDDLRIADRLGVSRQQVINLRKSARARLARRRAASPAGVVIPARFGRQTLREHS